MTDDLTDLEALAQAATPGPCDDSTCLTEFRRLANSTPIAASLPGGVAVSVEAPSPQPAPFPLIVTCPHGAQYFIYPSDLARAHAAESERDRWRSRAERHGDCIGCSDAPEEECPQHGRPCSEWAQIASDQIDRANRAEAERDEARAALAQIKALTEEHQSMVNPAPYTTERALIERIAALAGGDDRG